MQLSGEPCPSPTWCCHLAAIVTASSKGHSTLLSTQLPLDGGGYGHTSVFMSISTLPQFFGLEVHSLVRNQPQFTSSVQKSPKACDNFILPNVWLSWSKAIGSFEKEWEKD